MGPGSAAAPGEHEDHDRDDEQPAHGRHAEGTRSTPPTLERRPMSIPGIPRSSSVRTARTTAPIRVAATDRKSVAYGKSVAVRVTLGGRRTIQQKKKNKQH